MFFGGLIGIFYGISKKFKASDGIENMNNSFIVHRNTKSTRINHKLARLIWIKR